MGFDVLKGQLPGKKKKALKKGKDTKKKADDDDDQEVKAIKGKVNSGKKLAKAAEGDKEDEVVEKPGQTKKKKRQAEASGDENEEDEAPARKAAKGSKNKEKGKEAKEPTDAEESKQERLPAFVKSDYRVFVSSIPKSTPEDRLKKDFEECGEIVNIKLLMAGHSDESRGLAFITFKDEAGFKAALAFDKTDYGGNSLRVRKAEAPGTEVKNDRDDPGTKPEGCNSIVAKRLAPEVVEKDLQELFRRCGKGPIHVGLLRDKASGRSRCTARIDFEDTDTVDEAMKLNGVPLKKHPIVLHYCKPKTW
mmetsp:Transcript_7737/g.11163  ORF Transcript_7737/g.11163 Transcript_7737/m.11163 type:complete len:306 (-) Transcript_7737:33-950(-)